MNEGEIDLEVASEVEYCWEETFGRRVVALAQHVTLVSILCVITKSFSSGEGKISYKQKRKKQDKQELFFIFKVLAILVELVSVSL